MVIVFGNQKGGAGKSTLAILFANYLTLIKKRKLIVLDMDYQKTLLARYEEDKALENPELYEVIEVELENFPSIHRILKEDKSLNIFIDLPGKIDDENLLPVIQAADVFIIPFSYDKSTYQSTALFTLIVKELNPAAKKIFIPNRIKGTARYSLAGAINRDLEQYGMITIPLNDRVDFERLTLKDIPVHLQELVDRVFGEVFNHIGL